MCKIFSQKNILNCFESKDRTKTIANNLNPTWNHVSIFEAHRNDEIIEFEVFDEDIDADDRIGENSRQI